MHIPEKKKSKTPKRTKGKVVKVKVWAALDKKGRVHLWSEKRYAVYSATHSTSISLQRSKQPNNFILVPATLTYTTPNN